MASMIFGLMVASLNQSSNWPRLIPCSEESRSASFTSAGYSSSDTACAGPLIDSMVMIGSTTNRIILRQAV